MNLSKEKRTALIIIGFALFLNWLSWYLLKHTYAYMTYQTFEGKGLLLGMPGGFIWLYGLISYAIAKGRSSLTGFILSFFWIPGLIFLALLPDVKSKRSK